jgi:hypothetical protein
LTSVGESTPSITTIGNDTQTRNISLPIMRAGESRTFQLIIPLPAMPSLLTNSEGIGPTAKIGFVSRPGDRVQFQATLNVANVPMGATVTASKVTPQARAPGSQLFAGPTLPGGQAFTTFSALVSITLLASQATSAGSLAVTVNGTVTLQLGQGQT